MELPLWCDQPRRQHALQIMQRLLAAVHGHPGASVRSSSERATVYQAHDSFKTQDFEPQRGASSGPMAAAHHGPDGAQWPPRWKHMGILPIVQSRMMPHRK